MYTHKGYIFWDSEDPYKLIASNKMLEEDGYGVEEGCFAKVMEGSVWDSMTSDKIDEEHMQRVEKVLDFMKDDY